MATNFHIEALRIRNKAKWVIACNAEGIDPKAPFVVFSNDNQAAQVYYAGMTEYVKALSGEQAVGV